MNRIDQQVEMNKTRELAVLIVKTITAMNESGDTPSQMINEVQNDILYFVQNNYSLK